MNNIKSVAIIGSFRKKGHFEYIQKMCEAFQKIGLSVTSPKKADIIKPDISFVRLNTDPEKLSDEMVQTIALHRILRASFVYVSCIDGYIGKTTAYEIGRVIQSRTPIYFSQRPDDLPIYVPDHHVITLDAIIDLLKRASFVPRPLYSDLKISQAMLETELIDLDFRNEDELSTTSLHKLRKKRIVICGSMTFYAEMVEIQDMLRKVFVNAIIPLTDHDFSQITDAKAWNRQKEIMSQKYIRKLRDTKTYGVLIVNYDKNGIQNYIGPNAFAEIAVAFDHRKAIFLLQGIPEDYYEELTAWGVISLNGSLEQLISMVRSSDDCPMIQPDMFDLIY